VHSSKTSRNPGDIKTKPMFLTNDPGRPLVRRTSRWNQPSTTGKCTVQVSSQLMETSAQSVPNQTTPSTQTSPNQSKLSASTDQPAHYSTALKSGRSPKGRRTSRNQSQRENFSMKN